MYFSGQGKVYVAERDGSGNPGIFRFLGNVPELKIGLETDVVEHKESQSGNRVTDLRMTRETKASVSLTLEDFEAEKLAYGLYGTVLSVTGSSATGETTPTITQADIDLGCYLRTKYPKISTVAITGAVADTDFKVESADHGLIKVLTTVASAKALTYTYGGHKILKVLKDQAKERWLRFEGLNTADAGKPVLVELYKTRFDPAKDLSLIMDDVAKFPLEGSVLYDASKDADAQLGGFGRIVYL